MTLEELVAEARKQEASLTPGVWSSDVCFSGDKCWCRCIGTDDSNLHERGVIGSGCVSQNDAEGLVWIRNNLLEILKQVEERLALSPRSSINLYSKD